MVSCWKYTVPDDAMLTVWSLPPVSVANSGVAQLFGWPVTGLNSAQVAGIDASWTARLLVCPKTSFELSGVNAAPKPAALGTAAEPSGWDSVPSPDPLVNTTQLPSGDHAALLP